MKEIQKGTKLQFYNFYKCYINRGKSDSLDLKSNIRKVDFHSLRILLTFLRVSTLIIVNFDKSTILLKIDFKYISQEMVILPFPNKRQYAFNIFLNGD